MQIVGHKFEKISGERKGTLEGNKSISFNVDITKVETRDIFPGAAKQSGLGFDFKFTADYGGNSKLQVVGTLMGAGEEKELKKIAKDWKANKLEAEIDALIKNRVMVIATGKMVPLADSLNLPLPIRFPGKFVPPSDVKK